MRPRSQADGDQLDLFRAHFDQMLNPDHPLVVLAQKIDWQRFHGAFADCYCPDFGAPAKAVRLLVGLHYLKHAFDESDESRVGWRTPIGNTFAASRPCSTNCRCTRPR